MKKTKQVYLCDHKNNVYMMCKPDIKLTFEIVPYRVDIFMVQLPVTAGRVAVSAALQVR